MRRKIFSILLSLVLIVVTSIRLGAAAEPYYTFVPSGDRSIDTVPFYKVGGTVPYEFHSPNDLYVGEDSTIYVADQDRVVIFYPDGNGKIIGEGILTNARGIYVYNNEIFVADSDNAMVYRFDQEGNILQEYPKPEEPYFGSDTSYKPVGVVVSDTDSMYIASEGTNDGLIVRKLDGTFLNFYGANESQSSIYSSSILNSDLLAGVFKPKPTSITDVAIDSQNIIYTSTENQTYGVRKLNYTGSNIYTSPVEESNATIADIYIDKYDNTFVLSNDYIASVYNPVGDEIFSFGTAGEDFANVEGIVNTPGAIAVGPDQKIYVTDLSNNTLQVYVPTQTTQDIYVATNDYYQGNYVDSEETFIRILDQGISMNIAFDSLGQLNYQNQNYDEALKYFEQSDNKEKYSDTYYFIRGKYIADYFLYLVLIAIIIVILLKLYNIFKRKYKFSERKYLKSCYYFTDFLKSTLSKPKNSFYVIKYLDGFSIFQATIVYLLGAFVLVIGQYYSDFLFRNEVITRNISVVFLVGAYILVLFIIQLASYLVSSIMYGEGTKKDMYISFSLCLIPFIILEPIRVVFSYILTFNEQLLNSAFIYIYLVWGFVLFFLAIAEVHNFLTGKTIKNILITIFAIIVILAICIAFSFLSIELYKAVTDIIKEALL